MSVHSSDQGQDEARADVEQASLSEGLFASKTLCGGCAGSGRCRLGLELVRAGQGLAGTAVPSDSWEGAPGVAHGAWIASVFDEGLGAVVLVNDRWAVTKSLTVEFLKPVPIGTRVRFEARPEDVRGGQWTIGGELSHDGVALARARGLWIERDSERHLAPYRRTVAPTEER